jgi:hypothetical protein
VENAGGALAVGFERLAPERAARALTATFVLPEAIELVDDGLLAAPGLHPGRYALPASPTLYPGQTVSARVEADADNDGAVTCSLAARVYDGRDALSITRGSDVELLPGQDRTLEWRVGDTGGQPIAQIGVEVGSRKPVSGRVYVDRLTWDEVPEATFTRPASGGTMWRKAWVQHVDRFEPYWPEPYRLIQNRGRGLLIQGTREWDDYEVIAPLRPEAVGAAGIAARVQGLRRYYAVLLCDDHTVRLVKALDGEAVLAEAPLRREYGIAHDVGLRVQGTAIQARVDGNLVLAHDDEHRPLTGGAVALVCERGTMTCERVTVRR